MQTASTVNHCLLWSCRYLSYLPIAESKYCRFAFVLLLLVKAIFVHVSGNDLFKIACSRPWGAISITIAFFGTCFIPSSNKTGLSKLLVKYSAEHCCANSVFHWASGTDVLIHFQLRFFGHGITCKCEFTSIKTIARFVRRDLPEIYLF